MKLFKAEIPFLEEGVGVDGDFIIKLIYILTLNNFNNQNV